MTGEEFTLPLPPSTNNLFRNVNGKGRVKTDDYKAWQEAAGWALKAQRPTPIAGPVSISISIYRASKASDLDNRIKAVLDLIVEHSVIDDDRNVQEIFARWSNDTDGALVVVKPCAEVISRKPSRRRAA